MFAKRKSFVSFALLFVAMGLIGCIFLVACFGSNNEIEQDGSEPKDETIEQNGSGSNNQTIPNEGKDENGMKHYEIDLSMQNFSEFIKYTITETVANSENRTGNHYEFNGVLRFAYYKNVIVTLSATYQAPSWQGGEQTTFQFSVVLDAAGDFKFDTNNPIALEKLGWSFYKRGTTSQIEVIAVSGKVIFNI